MSVHHLTGSAQLLTLLNRLENCISYYSVLQLETSIAEKIIISDSVLPDEILNVKNIVLITAGTTLILMKKHQLVLEQHTLPME